MASSKYYKDSKKYKEGSIDSIRSGFEAKKIFFHSISSRRIIIHLTKATYRAFSLTWPASMQIYWGKKESVYIGKEFKSHWIGLEHQHEWPPFHCFGTLIWPTSCENAL